MLGGKPILCPGLPSSECSQRRVLSMPLSRGGLRRVGFYFGASAIFQDRWGHAQRAWSKPQPRVHVAQHILLLYFVILKSFGKNILGLILLKNNCLLNLKFDLTQHQTFCGNPFDPLLILCVFSRLLGTTPCNYRTSTALLLH